MTSCLDCLFFLGLEMIIGESFTVSHNYEPGIIDITATYASLPTTASSSMDLGHPHGFPQLYKPWTSTWSLELGIF